MERGQRCACIKVESFQIGTGESGRRGASSSSSGSEKGKSVAFFCIVSTYAMQDGDDGGEVEKEVKVMRRWSEAKSLCAVLKRKYPRSNVPSLKKPGRRLSATFAKFDDAHLAQKKQALQTFLSAVLRLGLADSRELGKFLLLGEESFGERGADEDYIAETVPSPPLAPTSVERKDAAVQFYSNRKK